jgi:NtrC-family two-component system sensor histidine kinase KinB
MSREAISNWIIWLLTLVVGVALLLNLPDGASIGEFGLQALVYAGLTAFALYFGVLLTEGEFSAAHVIGMMAFLTLPAQAHHLLLWAIFLGGVVGGTALLTRAQESTLRRRLTARTARSVVVISARVALSFLIASKVYLLAGGDVPLTAPFSNEVLPLSIFSLVYWGIYALIFLLETYSDGRSVENLLRENLLLIAAILIVPIPFGILAALMIVVAPSALAITAIGAILITLGMHGLSRTQYQLQKQVEELRSLATVGQALQSNLQLSGVLETVYEQVSGLIDLDQFIVALYDPDDERLRFPLAIGEGQPMEGGIDDTSRRLLNQVLQKQEALLVSQDSALAILQAPSLQLESWLGVPLLAGGKVVGAMVVTSSDPKQHFSADDLRLLTTVAASAGVTIENAQLYERQMARANQLNTLNQILRLLTGSLSPDEVMDVIVSSASLVSQATGVALFMFAEESHQMTLMRIAGMSDPFAQNPPLPLLTDIKQPPIFIDNVLEDARAAPFRPVMGGEGKAAWAELPLTVGQIAIGLMVFYYDQKQRFSADQIEILQAFTNQAAQAIRNARLYTTADETLERRAEQMYALAALGRQLTATMSLRSICNLVLARALELTRTSTGFIVLKDNDDLMIGAESGYPHLLLNPAQVAISLTGKVLEGGQSVRYNDLRVEHTAPPLMKTTRSQLTVPILRGSETLGAITLESNFERAFSEEDTHFVTQLANQTMIAIDNTRLFERIAEARDQLQVILNTMTEAIMLVEKSGQITMANPRVDLIGLTPRALLNHNIDVLLDRPELDLAERMGFQSDQKVRKLLKELRTPGSWTGVESHSYTVEAEQGAVYIKREVIPIGNDSGDPIGMLMVFYDETEEQELSRMRDDLSSMIVHDLRSPLTAVTTGLRLLRDYVPNDSTFRPLVETTTETSQRAIRKLMSRVDSLLDISKLESGQINLETEPTDLATLADSVCMELSPLAHELEVRVTSEVMDALPPLNIDGDKVERVLQNLVDNALKFCPAYGSVTIRAHMPNMNGAPEGFVRVEVVDTGPGVPDEYKTRLFERFVQVKGRRGARRGIGLGLTFCRLVTEAHGGRIWIEDNPAGGSIFVFTLPVVNFIDPHDTNELPVVRG